ncbi:MAG: hypothetical protein JXB48_02305 [Candidatus Latescibacteria bacterium]|nr:hypothetical protein [Candidatus Latescibacterota bacterium]
MNDTIKDYIYRFMSFESFVDMVQRKALAFFLHDKWEDPFESFILKTMKLKEGRQEILRILKEMTQDLAMENFEKILKFYTVVFSQSWTECKESDALWRIYSHNNMSIRTEIRTTNILNLFQEPTRVTAHKMQYSNTISIKSQLKDIIDDDKIKIEKIFLTKRKEFSHEKEIRLVTLDLLNYSKQTPFQRDIMKELFEEGEIEEEYYKTYTQFNSSRKISDVKYVSYGDITEFISSVMLHPLAPNWCDETVRTFCKNNNLNYIGKSKLYQFNYDGP